MRKPNETRVKTMGVKMHANLPAFPMLTGLKTGREFVDGDGRCLLLRYSVGKYRGKKWARARVVRGVLTREIINIEYSIINNQFTEDGHDQKIFLFFVAVGELVICTGQRVRQDWITE